MRLSLFPTKDELKEWESSSSALSPESESQRREKARKLVLERGLPEALRGVMGNAASAECCGVMFDALQEEPVARGVVCGVLLEAIRGVCH
jgi:hypothetical protein